MRDLFIDPKLPILDELGKALHEGALASELHSRSRVRGALARLLRPPLAVLPLLVVAGGGAAALAATGVIGIDTPVQRASDKNLRHTSAPAKLHKPERALVTGSLAKATPPASPHPHTAANSSGSAANSAARGSKRNKSTKGGRDRTHVVRTVIPPLASRPAKPTVASRPSEPEEAIPASVRSELLERALEVASKQGDSSPTAIEAVATTYGQEAQALRGGAPGGSPANTPTYVVEMHLNSAAACPPTPSATLSVPEGTGACGATWIVLEFLAAALPEPLGLTSGSGRVPAPNIATMGTPVYLGVTQREGDEEAAVVKQREEELAPSQAGQEAAKRDKAALLEEERAAEERQRPPTTGTSAGTAIGTTVGTASTNPELTRERLAEGAVVRSLAASTAGHHGTSPRGAASRASARLARDTLRDMRLSEAEVATGRCIAITAAPPERGCRTKGRHPGSLGQSGHAPELHRRPR